MKMKNDKAKFKIEFKKRLYAFVLKLNEFIDGLPKDNVSRRDFTNYFNIALKSANESKLWLAPLRDSKRVKPGDVEWFLHEAGEISNIFASSILTLEGKK